MRPWHKTHKPKVPTRARCRSGIRRVPAKVVIRGSWPHNPVDYVALFEWANRLVKCGASFGGAQ